MKLKWWGHSCFLIEEDGKKIITDPYDDSLPYSKVDDRPDIVTVSHDHFDHNAVERLEGDFEVVKTKDGYQDDNIEIKGIKTFHDKDEGEDRGENLIFTMQFSDKKLCHIGDLGHPLTEDEFSQLEDIDILLIPVGGYYTINADEAFEIAQKIDPKYIVPMHYKTDILDFPITGVEDFIHKFDHDAIEIKDGAEVDLDDVPEGKKVIVVNYVHK